MGRPKEILLEGVEILENVLLPEGFVFRFGGEGKGSGGQAAWGDFIREGRRLELHFRWSLGLVRYHIGTQGAYHESYMRELGVWGQCRYPGFSDDPLNAFRGLAHDLLLADDFVCGSGNILKQAARKEAALEAERTKDLSAAYGGDRRN